MMFVGHQKAIASLLIGFGLFNLVEGLIDHQILGIHHVKPGPNQLAWDLGFLALGAIAVAIGSVMIQQNKQQSIVNSHWELGIGNWELGIGLFPIPHSLLCEAEYV